jgi:hypothetical protein
MCLILEECPGVNLETAAVRRIKIVAELIRVQGLTLGGKN